MGVSAKPTSAEQALGVVPQDWSGESCSSQEIVQRTLPHAPSNGLALSLEHRRLRVYLILLVADATILLGCFAVVGWAYEPARFNNSAMLSAYLLLPLFQTIALYNSTYSRDGLVNWQSASTRGITALFISALLLNFFAFFAKSNAEFSRVVFAFGMLGTAALMTLLRFSAARLIKRNWGPSATNRLLVDAGGREINMAHSYRVNAHEHGLRPDANDPVALDRLAKYFLNMDQVVVSCRLEDRTAWAEILKGAGIHGEVISDYARDIGALGIINHERAEISTLLVSTGQLALRKRVIKRSFDLFAASGALIALSPILLACALAIKLQDGGPVFFKQRRMGRGNKFFEIYKFRSMCSTQSDLKGVRSASKDDERITRVGKLLRRTSLDELPQFINVLKGDMSSRS